MNDTNFPPKGPEGDIVVTDKGTRYVLHLNTITHLQSRRIYTVIHIKGKPCIIDSKNLGYYERELENTGFFRIHRSCIINLYEVVRYEGKRGLKITLSDNSQVQVSYLRRAKFIKCIEELTRNSRRAG